MSVGLPCVIIDGLLLSGIITSVLVSAKWEELPLSELHRCCLAEAVENLPFFFTSPHAALDDDEVVSFTQNGGWQKVDSLLPPLFISGYFDVMYYEEWINILHQLSNHLQVSLSVLHCGSV
jgi:hypothetical protein